MGCDFEPALFLVGVANAGKKEMWWVVRAMLHVGLLAVVPACAQLLGGGTGRATCAPWSGCRPLAGASSARGRAWLDRPSRRGVAAGEEGSGAAARAP
eukprot:scaffold197729_cov32-Tisochrysis_lutea.AAC.1